MVYDAVVETISREGPEIVGVPSSSERAPARAATVPTVPRGNRPAARTTLAVIAAEAGVSLPTVSKVVNGRPDVAADTRARVERLLEEHQYTRTGTGRQRLSGVRFRQAVREVRSV